jgi:hypothetical protein
MQQQAGAPDIGQTEAFPEGRGSARAGTDTSNATTAAIAPRSLTGALDERSITRRLTQVFAKYS